MTDFKQKAHESGDACRKAWLEYHKGRHPIMTRNCVWEFGEGNVWRAAYAAGYRAAEQHVLRNVKTEARKPITVDELLPKWAPDICVNCNKVFRAHIEARLKKLQE